MVQRYSDYDIKKGRNRSERWVMRNYGMLVKVVGGLFFVWTFGRIYALMWFPPAEIRSLSIDPRFSEDKKALQARVEQRDRELAKKLLQENPERKST